MASTSDDISELPNNVIEIKQEIDMEVCFEDNVDSPDDLPRSLDFKECFYQRLIEYEQQHQGSYRKPWTSERIEEIINEIKTGQVAINSSKRRTSMGYYWMSKYDIMTAANKTYLTFKKRTPYAPSVRILPREQYFDVISETHKSWGHGGRDKILGDLKTRYYIPKKAVEIFVSLCPTCETKRNVQRKYITTKPIEKTSCDFNMLGQFNLINFQFCPDREFKWLLYYQDDATKFINFRPLKTNEAVEVASELCMIFLTFGPPNILESNNNPDLIANVLKELVSIWPECKIVHGDSQPQNQSSEETKEVENMLQAWMNENKSKKWSIGCFYVQYLHNSSSRSAIGTSPYKALFGNDPKPCSSISNMPTPIISTIKTEEQSNTEEVPTVDTYGSNSNYNHNSLHSVSNSVVHGKSQMIENEDDYSSKIIKVEQQIEVEIDNVHKELKRAAETIVETSVNKMPYLGIGSSVLVTVPKVDRGPENVKYVYGKIVDTSNGVHRIGTRNGTIKNWFSRRDLHLSDTKYSDEISETPINMGEAVACQAPIYGQRVLKCGCKPAVNQCHNNRCACFKSKVLCGSECHGSLTCINE